MQCFYATEERTRTIEVEQEGGTIYTEEEMYTVTVPLSLESTYNNLTALLGREISNEDRGNTDSIDILIRYGNAVASDFKQGGNNMKESMYKHYDELPLFLSAELVVKVLSVSSFIGYELMHEKDFPVLNGNRMIVLKERFIQWVKEHTGGAR